MLDGTRIGLHVQHDRGVSRTPSGEIDTGVDRTGLSPWMYAGPMLAQMIDKLCWANIGVHMYHL